MREGYVCVFTFARMSINVTVKGNPVSIRHGKMVTTTGDSAKNEFDKRRRIRLEQVGKIIIQSHFDEQI